MKIDTLLENIPFIKIIESETNLDKKTILNVFLIFSSLSIITMFGINILIYLVGILYPAYMSFKSLQTPKNDDNSQWLTYWIVFSTINLFDILAYIIPFYYILKLVYIIWLFHEKTKGAQILYIKYIEPFLKDNENNIDKNIENVEDIIKDKIKEVINDEDKKNI